MKENIRLKKTKAKSKGDIKFILLPIISVFGFLFIWQIIAELGPFGENMLPPPTKVIFYTFVHKLTEAFPDGNVLSKNILVSLKIVSGGFILAIIVGVPLGLLMGWFKTLDRIVRPLFEIIRPIPPIAWIPLSILWVGIGAGAKIMIIFLAAFVPCVVNSYTGIQQTDVILIDVAKTFGATNYQMFKKVGIPYAMPMVFAGIKVAVSAAWATLVAAELLAANAGLGYMISMGRQLARPDLIILGMLLIGVLGYIFNNVSIGVENIIMKWRRV